MKLISLLTTLCLAVATTATAQEVNIRSMHEICQTEEYKNNCFVLPESSGRKSMTLNEFTQGSQRAIEVIIELNSWEGADGDTIIPAGVYFRAG